MTKTDRLAQALRKTSCPNCGCETIGWERETCADCRERYDALASLAPAAVEGDACGVLLPCEPTKEILAAMTDGWSCGGDPRGEYHDRYRQMLNVASKAPRNCAKLRNELDRYISNTDALRAPVNKMRETAKLIAEAGCVVKPINERARQETPPPVGTKFDAAINEERRKFQQETLRTSELTQMLTKFVEEMHREHEQGAWSKGCVRCQLILDAKELLARPINRAHEAVVPFDVYESAVSGRREFRLALRDEREKVAALTAQVAALTAQCEGLRKALTAEQHLANEWADCATNGLQWLRNVKDSVSSPDAGVREMTENIKRITAIAAGNGEGV